MGVKIVPIKRGHIGMELIGSRPTSSFGCNCSMKRSSDCAIPSSLKPLIVCRYFIRKFCIPKILYILDDASVLHNGGADPLQTGHHLGLGHGTNSERYFVVDHCVIRDVQSITESYPKAVTQQHTRINKNRRLSLADQTLTLSGESLIRYSATDYSG